MPIKDVGELVNALENAGELKRISAQVDPDLEIAEILRRTMYAKGPAILFENVKGYDMPVLGNAFGSEKMLAEAFLASHTCQCILLDRKTCPVCGKKCHHDTPNRVKVMAGPV